MPPLGCFSDYYLSLIWIGGYLDTATLITA
jgi:hypothetical protein